VEIALLSPGLTIYAFASQDTSGYTANVSSMFHYVITGSVYKYTDFITFEKYT